MSGIIFENDPSARKATRFLLLVQIGAVGLVLALILLQLYSLALSISCTTFFVLAGTTFWLYLHYLRIPIVREKSQLKKRVLDLQYKLASQGNIIQAAIRKRTALFQDQRDEINLALYNSQQAYIRNGLEGSPIKDAQIPGVGPKLKERLAQHRILSAAQINPEKLSRIPGIGESKQQALFRWRNMLKAGFETTIPVRLAEGQAEHINRKYQALHYQNDLAERNAQARKRDCTNELNTVRPRLEQVASLSFISYVSTSLDSRRAVGILLVLILIVAQVVSSVSATASALVAFVPAATAAPTSTTAPAATPRRIITSTATIANTRTVTLTPALTATSTITLTPQVTLPPGAHACIPQGSTRETALVVSIIDGDTIDVNINGRVFRVRYIGINSPERDQPFYDQATAYNERLVYNKTVMLVKDISETDQFDRLLRYIIVDSTFVNHELVNLGYAQASAYPPDVSCAAFFETAQRQAQASGLGLWMPVPPPYFAPTQSPGAGNANCHPSYPGVCIPPPPPDLDCPQISYTDFTVLSPDPHNFDRDSDGIGCES